ncbi:MAG: tetratricopeptide repeat protein, partial [Nitrospira sp.]|nr:tetratricopeptide repeat protein [Nitrospira sp.]
QAVSYARTHLGEEHPDTLTSMSNLASTLSHQGDYAGAVALQRTVLERRQRILGEEHPDTSISAWNYLNTLLNSGDIETAVQIIRRYLLWLLERDPSTLGGTQQQIRTGVVQILESSRESAEGS